MQGGGGEDVLAARGLDVDGGQGLIAQAVAVLQQDQVVGLQHPLGDRPGPRQRVADRGGGQDLVVADAGVVDARRLIGQGDDGGVQLARLQPGDQARGQVLADEETQGRVAVAQAGQGARQEKGGDGGDDAEAEPARQGLARVARRLDQILGAGQDVLGALDRLGADGGQLHRAARAFDDGCAQDLLQLLHPCRQGWLADMGRLRRTAEGGVLGQELEIVELSQGGEHAPHIGAPYGVFKDNRNH